MCIRYYRSKKMKEERYSGPLKRIFITTGLISLVNTLVITRERNANNFEDTLVVISFNQSDDFICTQKTIASLHNFKQIFFFKKGKEIFKNIDIKKYDEVYCTTISSSIFKIFQKPKKVFILDEGPGYGIFDMKRFKNVEYCYVTNFLNKFSFPRKSKNTQYSYIDSDTFRKVSSEILKLFSEKDNVKSNKNVLFVGHYIYRKLGNDAALSFYQKYINYFLDKEYNVYFKSHPRDNDIILPKLKEIYAGNKKFNILNTKLPIEIYNFNFDIVTGAYSGVLVSLPHYRNIPSINLPLKELYYTDVGIHYKKFFALYDYYTPTFDEMQDVIGKSKTDIIKRYNEIIKNKLSIEDNIELKKIILYNPYSVKNLLLLHKNFKPY